MDTTTKKAAVNAALRGYAARVASSMRRQRLMEQPNRYAGRLPSDRVLFGHGSRGWARSGWMWATISRKRSRSRGHATSPRAASEA